jgi:hypothetical protein
VLTEPRGFLGQWKSSVWYNDDETSISMDIYPSPIEGITPRKTIDPFG